MIYRPLGASGLTVSEVGVGCEHLQDKPLSQIQSVLDEALNQGVNIIDLFMSQPQVRIDIGQALKGRRGQMQIQGHIGAGWVDGQYCRVRKPEQYRRFFEDLLNYLQTDYMDIGMLHFIDTQADMDVTLESGMLDYAVELKKKGVIRAVGMSSHDPVTALKMIETGAIDVMMFSINPAYDAMPPEADVDGLMNLDSYKNFSAFEPRPERVKLYRACEARGVGITVMKSLGAGALLDARRSPFGEALTLAQCIHYALTRPAVSSVLVGCKTPEEVRAAVHYENTTEQERDYAKALHGMRFSPAGQCMYCNHCLPCPSEIDVAQVNKYLDLAELETEPPATVREHYLALSHHASECIACGSCEANCPFGVPVIQKMERAARVFGA
jgi:predicted aldo/keto reductase-like oxidoreductase